MSGAHYYLIGMALTTGAIWFAPGLHRIRRRLRGQRAIR